MRIAWVAALAAVVLGSVVASSEASAQAPQRWVLLGCREVAFHIDRDAVPVGLQKGFFHALRLRASRSNIYMLDLRVIYGNGEPDDLPVRAEIRSGGMSGRLDLRGRERGIQRIEMIYRAQPNFRGRATVCVDGLQDVAAPARQPRWVLFGCRDVGFQIDRDVLPVPQQRSNFSSIRLRVAGNAVNIYDLKVVYGNGQVHDIPVRAEIRAGGVTPAFDLIGRERGIDRIEMVYQSRPNFRGRASVCVEGLD